MYSIYQEGVHQSILVACGMLPQNLDFRIASLLVTKTPLRCFCRFSYADLLRLVGCPRLMRFPAVHGIIPRKHPWPVTVGWRVCARKLKFFNSGVCLGTPWSRGRRRKSGRIFETGGRFEKILMVRCGPNTGSAEASFFSITMNYLLYYRAHSRHIRPRSGGVPE